MADPNEIMVYNLADSTSDQEAQVVPQWLQDFFREDDEYDTFSK